MPEPTQPTHEQATAADDEQRVAWYELSLGHAPSHARMWLVAVIGLTVDLWSKHWAFTELQGFKVIVPHLLHFRRSLNPGALFGLGQGLTTVFIAASILALLFVLYLFAHTPRNRLSMHVALGMILAGALGNMYDRAFVRADAVWAPSTVGWRSWFGDEVHLTGKLIREEKTYWVFADWPEGGGRERFARKRKGWRIQPSPVVRDFIKIETAWLPRGVQLWKWIFNVADLLLVMGVGTLLINFRRDRRAHLRARAARGESAQEAHG